MREELMESKNDVHVRVVPCSDALESSLERDVPTNWGKLSAEYGRLTSSPDRREPCSLVKKLPPCSRAPPLLLACQLGRDGLGLKKLQSPLG